MCMKFISGLFLMGISGLLACQRNSKLIDTRDFYAQVVDYTTGIPQKKVKIYLTQTAADVVVSPDTWAYKQADTSGRMNDLINNIILDSTITDEQGYFYFKQLIAPPSFLKYQLVVQDNSVMRLFAQADNDLNVTRFYTDKKRTLLIQTHTSNPFAMFDTLLVSTKIPEPNYAPFYLSRKLFGSKGSSANEFMTSYSYALAKQVIVEYRVFRKDTQFAHIDTLDLSSADTTFVQIQY